jgi:hypothetical protein
MSANSSEGPPNAWDDDWEKAADVRFLPPFLLNQDHLFSLRQLLNSILTDIFLALQDLSGDETPPPPEKKVSSKVTKAQRRAQQAEFNRQLWAEA